MYLAYNKSIADESSTKFGKKVDCLTTHSLAHDSIVKENNYNIDEITWRDIPDIVRYKTKLEIIDYIKEYSLSDKLSWSDFVQKHKLRPTIDINGTKLIKLMESGKIPLTHEYYLKMFHIALVNNDVYFDQLDLLMLDEAGDLNKVTLEIFKLLPAKLKIAVGDQYQNIYGFNHTVNCFDLLDDKQFSLTKSFRVSVDIAKSIENFCIKNIDKDMIFKGTDSSDELKTKAFICKTNLILVDEIVKSQKLNINYKLTRTVDSIFKLPIILSKLGFNKDIRNKQYKYLEKDINFFYQGVIDVYIKNNKISTISKKDYETLTNTLSDINYYNMLKYIKNKYKDNIKLSQALNIVIKNKKENIADLCKLAKKQEKKNETIECKYTICTAHSSKGLEFSNVFISDDLNDSVKSSIEHDGFSKEHKELLNLYYVACTRASIKLDNATQL